MSRLVEQMKRKRLARGLSIQGLAKIIGVSFSSIARLERGIGKPNVHSAERIRRWIDDDAVSAPKLRTPREEGWFTRMDRRVTELEIRIDQLTAERRET